MWKTFLFLSGYKVIFRDAWVLSLPGSRFIHNFFRSNARTSRNNSVRILTLPGSTVPGRNSRCNPRTGTRWWTQAVHPVFPLSPASDIAFCPAPRKQTPSDLFHIFNAAHLLLKFPAFFLAVVGGLYEVHLPLDTDSSPYFHIPHLPPLPRSRSGATRTTCSTWVAMSLHPCGPRKPQP